MSAADIERLGEQASFGLDGRTALVVGAGGIGLATAAQLLAYGARVAVADVTPPDDLRRTVDDFGLGDAVTLHHVDVTAEASCRALVGEVLASHDGLDILVNCFGINARARSEELDPTEWDRIIDINLSGTFRMSQAAYQALTSSAHPAIVNLSSTAAKIAVADNAHYSVSKAGISHLTRMLASDWAAVGIRVNAVGPTIVPTAMTSVVRADPDYMRDKLASIPMGRMASPGDVASAVHFLASSAAGMITGQTLFVDGGVTLR